MLRHVSFLALLWTAALGQLEVNHTHLVTAEELKQKWSVANVLRDLDHVKEDMAYVIELTDLGQISEKDMVFYLIRMHDFDDNGALDGIELRVALQHSIEHHAQEGGQKDEEIQKVIDDFLDIDSNNDGFVDYREFVEQIKKKPNYQEL